MTACDSELLQLKNLGMAWVNILRAIGINTYADLNALVLLRLIAVYEPATSTSPKSCSTPCKVR